MVMSDQLHALAALPLGGNSGAIEYGPGRASESV